MMKAKTLPVFAILMLLSLRSAADIEFQITPKIFENNAAWKNMLDNATIDKPNVDLNIELNDIIATESNKKSKTNIDHLIDILDDTTLTKVTFCDLPGESTDKRNYLRVIKNKQTYDIENNDKKSNNLPENLDEFCEKNKLTEIPDINNNLSFEGTFNFEEDKLPDLSGVNNHADSLELYIESATNIAAVFKIGGSRRLLIL